MAFFFILFAIKNIQNQDDDEGWGRSPRNQQPSDPTERGFSHSSWSCTVFAKPNQVDPLEIWKISWIIVILFFKKRSYQILLILSKCWQQLFVDPFLRYNSLKSYPRETLERWRSFLWSNLTDKSTRNPSKTNTRILKF